MIGIGNTENAVHGIFVGDTRIKSVYLGDQKVFPKNLQPFNIEDEWEEEDDNFVVPEETNEPRLSEQIEWVSRIQKIDSDNLPDYSLTPEQQRVLEELVREMVEEDPSLNVIEVLDENP